MKAKLRQLIFNTFGLCNIKKGNREISFFYLEQLRPLIKT